MAVTAPSTQAPGTSVVGTAGLTKRFQDRVVVDDLDLEIPAGSVCGFVGPNGAGKTTTIRMLLGLVRPSAGRGTVLGGTLDDPASYLSRVGALIEAPAFYPQLSGRDNLLVLTRLGGLPSSVVRPALARGRLADRADDRVRRYSLGMKQRLGIAAALLPDPELLILDEPTNGLDPAGIVETRSMIRALADDGITILVSSHLLGEIEQVCDHLVLIRDGRLLFQGSTHDLRATQRAEVALRPEHAGDLERLAVITKGAGFDSRTAHGATTLLVAAAPTAAADLNRLAMSHGITLAELAARSQSLEEAFFALTGAPAAADADADPGPVALGRTA